MYFLFPDFIKFEIEHAFGDDRFKGIKPMFYSPKSNIESNSESVGEIIQDIKCDNDVLIMFEESYPQPVISNNLCTSVGVHAVGNICGMLVGQKILDEHLNACDFVSLPGWMDNWQENILDFSVYGSDPRVFFAENYSSILVVDTGFYSELSTKVNEFSKFTALPFQILPANPDYFLLCLENIILRWGTDKKQGQLKLANKKTASYAMSLDFVRRMADVSDEDNAIDSICKLFELMFAPQKVVYHSFVSGDTSYCHSSMDNNLINYFRHSDASYLVFDKDDSFAVKILTKDELLGMVEVCHVSFPEYVEEYLSFAMDIAKASGLTLLNIRRYNEISRSKMEYAEIADLLRTTNRILRHDIANSLHIVTSALDLYSTSDDFQFVDMAKKAANKGVSIIRYMHDLDLATSSNTLLEVYNVKDFILSSIEGNELAFSITGECLVKADTAFNSVVSNIVGNARVHGKASRIDVNIVECNGICRIEFSDDGIGIPDDVKSRVFDEGFKYGDTGHTGFGLFIVKKTIERYGGKVWVEDNVPSGAKFIIEVNAVSSDDL
jgi:two-component sensor histidine kinase